MILDNSTVMEVKVLWDSLSCPEMVPEMREIVKPDMFEDEENRKFWETICEKSSEGNPLDSTAVMSYTSAEHRKLFIDNMSLGSSSTDCLSHASAMKDLFVKRNAFQLGADLMKRVDQVTNIEDIMTRVRQFTDLIEGVCSSSSTKTIQQSVDELAEQLREVYRKSAAGEPTFVPTGFNFLDLYFKGGLRGGNVLVLAARPGVGKTSVMLAMIKAAVINGFPVKFYSLEMKHTELAEKIMYNLGGLLSGEMLTGAPDWHGRWASAKAQLANWGLYIEDSLSNVNDIISDITLSRQQGKCSVAFIDYLGLMSVSDDRLSIYQATCEKTRKIKRLALLQDIPVIMACQLNRDSVRENRDPDLQDLRDSGSIEQDADKIVFLSRKKVGDNKFQLKMGIGKNRQGGGTGEHVFLNPNPTYSAFEETQEAQADVATQMAEKMESDLPF